MRPPISSFRQLARALPACLAMSLLVVSCSCSVEVPAASSDLSSIDTNKPATAAVVSSPTVSTVSAGDTAQATVGAGDTAQATVGAKIRFRTLVHDFGKVDDTDELDYKFKFTNEGSGVLEIKEVKPSCGCTTTKLEKMVYEPGEEGDVELIFKPKGYGQQTKTITVKSNSAGSERVIVRIKAEVTPFVQFEPRFIRFTEVPTTEGRQEEVTVTCRDPEAIFGSPQCSNPNFEVHWTSPPLNGTGKFLVRLKPGAPRGSVINKVNLQVQGTPKPGALSIRHPAQISASAAVFGSIIIDPVYLSVGGINSGGRVDKSVELRRPNDQPFAILAVELKDSTMPNLEVSVTPKGAGWTVRVQGSAGTYQGLVRGNVVLTTDVPGDPTLKIPVQGAVRPDPKK